MNFDVTTERLSGQQVVISPAGEVDLYTAPELKQELLDAIESGATDVIVDLTRTTFIDSAALGVLVGAVRRLRERDGRLSIVCSERSIRKIFEITGLDRVLAIHASRQEALGVVGSAV
jgi:anti-sigma B factor antagonist